MTKEDKELLLKDLCARLPYKVEVHIKGEYKIPRTIYDVHMEDKTIGYFKGLNYNEEFIENVKPYLRPMSSMNKEECMEWREYMTDIEDSCYELVNERIAIMQDWLNTHHFDYRRLIEKGLALEAPEDMYIF